MRDRNKRPLHKTLPKSNAFINFSQKFYETDCKNALIGSLLGNRKTIFPYSCPTVRDQGGGVAKVKVKIKYICMYCICYVILNKNSFTQHKYLYFFLIFKHIVSSTLFRSLKESPKKRRLLLVGWGGGDETLATLPMENYCFADFLKRP